MRMLSCEVDRLFSSFEIAPLLDCWNWKKAKKAKGSYHGVVGIRRKTFLAHRVMYALYAGWEIDFSRYILILHRCNNDCCVNPTHLYVGTHKDNARDRQLYLVDNVPCVLGHKRIMRNNKVVCPVCLKLVPTDEDEENDSSGIEEAFGRF